MNGKNIVTALIKNAAAFIFMVRSVLNDLSVLGGIFT
jgi:hypothetical protein